jgi:hypothetical protein
LCQFKALPVGKCLQSVPTDDEPVVSIDSHSGKLRRGTTQNRFHPDSELSRRKRLYDIVVCSEFQAKDPVSLFRSCSENNNRQGRKTTVRAYPTADLESVQVGKH